MEPFSSGVQRESGQDKRKTRTTLDRLSIYRRTGLKLVHLQIAVVGSLGGSGPPPTRADLFYMDVAAVGPHRLTFYVTPQGSIKRLASELAASAPRRVPTLLGLVAQATLVPGAAVPALAGRPYWCKQTSNSGLPPGTRGQLDS